MFKRLNCWWNGCHLDIKKVQGERIVYCKRCAKYSEDEEDDIFYSRMSYRHETFYHLVKAVPKILLWAFVAFFIITILVSLIDSANTLSIKSSAEICKITAEINNLEYYYDSNVGCLIKYEDFFVKPR
jgi:uncharacterized paraquat-inducible protein A